MAQLEFYFKDFIEEIKIVSKLAKDFIQSSGNNGSVFDDYINQLEQLRTAKQNTEKRVEIREDFPLQTIVSPKLYERGERRGEYNVFAKITSTWDIKVLERKEGSKSIMDRKFALSGIASTKVRICKKSSEEELVVWNMDVANDHAPGCYFHAQIPCSLPIPRLPIFFAIPTVALEYVLSELFQDRWKQSLKEGYDLGQWRKVQRFRLKAQMNAHLEELDSKAGSPWVALKEWQPQANLFLDIK